ncbi:hypothetical protein WDW86_20550 [Bdellovibrionota bacterium FG-2]
MNAGVLGGGAGASHSCALVSGGVKCWGQNSSGQLGNGLLANSQTPVQVTGLTSGVQALTAGENHTCALVHGAAQCWGANSQGQLGNATTTDSLTPVTVRNVANSASLASVGALSVRGSHSCVVSNGAAFCFGDNSMGQLGNGLFTNSSIPVAVTGAAAGAQAMALGGAHSCAVVNGAAKCWGYNHFGQVGDGSTVNKGTAVLVVGPLGVGFLSIDVSAVSAGEFQSCALVGALVKCWGRNGFGQLGNNSLIDSLAPVSSVALQ